MDIIHIHILRSMASLCTGIYKDEVHFNSHLYSFYYKCFHTFTYNHNIYLSFKYHHDLNKHEIFAAGL
jgi:hypothetical protein